MGVSTTPPKDNPVEAIASAMRSQTREPLGNYRRTNHHGDAGIADAKQREERVKVPDLGGKAHSTQGSTRYQRSGDHNSAHLIAIKHRSDVQTCNTTHNKEKAYRKRNMANWRSELC